MNTSISTVSTELPKEMVDDIIKSIFHPRTQDYIHQLAETCLYGDNFRDVVIGLVDEGIRNAIKHGFLK